MPLKKTIEVLERYLRGKASLEEEARVEKWYEGVEEKAIAEEDLNVVREVIYGRIVNELHAQAPVVPMYRRKAFKWIAAALIVGVLATVAIRMIVGGDANKGRTEVAKTHDVPAPSNTRAVITLADGSKVYLDSAGNGMIAQQNNVAVVKNSNGEIVYAMSPAGGGDLKNSPNNKRPGVDYNTLFNPRGSKVISLTLSDGTKVWLNSESSLRYPASFVGNAREVEITGEAYFEVAHNAAKPFHVKKGETDVTVLGTHFNVNAYDDEDVLRVTLLEGSVKVSAHFASSASSAVIKPGQQAVVNTTSHSLLATSSIDLDEVMAWQRGRFEFNNAGLQTILRQVSRWYDVDVVYEKQPKLEPLGGGISRSLPLSEVLKLLEANGAKFRLDGRRLIVL